ncbi:MAG: phosphatase PAP2 family protein [Flavobacteriaceae bacterium]
MIQLDEQFFLFLNSLGSSTWDGFWLFMTNKYNMIPLYLFLLIYSFKHIGWKNGLWFVFTIALLISCTDQTTNLFKDGFERLRPCHDPDIAPLMRLVKERCGGLYGFFSGHASNSFALAVFFITFFKTISPTMRWLLLWAAIVAYSRVYVGVHYPIDIISGAFFGSLIGFFFARIARRFLLP